MGNQQKEEKRHVQLGTTLSERLEKRRGTRGTLKKSDQGHRH